MTEEQIKNLKKGDTFTLKLTVVAGCQEGVYADLAGIRFDLMTDKVLRHATLVKTAHTFEVGDTVCVVPDPLTGDVYGHDAFHNSARYKHGTIVRQGPLNDFEVAINNASIFVNIHCIELIKKAVKDKYKVEKDDINFCVTDGKWAIAHFSISSHPNAKAAAKAECDRLNAEWRKQQESQNND